MRVLEYVRIEDLKSALERDAARPTRYNARIVLVSGLQGWRDVFTLLQGQVGQVIRLSELCAGDDLPSPQTVISAVEAAMSESLMVVPLGEVLRLAPSTIRSYVTWLAQLSRPGRSRIYVPLLDAPGKVREKISDCPHYLSEVPEQWHYIGPGEIDIYVTPVEVACQDRQILDGIPAYLRCWENGGTGRGLLVTDLAQYLSDYRGDFTVHVCRNAFDVVQTCLNDVASLSRAFGTDRQWTWLAQQLAPTDERLAQTARGILNVLDYDSDHLFALWSNLTDEERWLTWLWSKAQTQAECQAYLDTVIKATSSFRELGDRVIDLVLEKSGVTLDDLRARRTLIQSLSVERVSVQFLDSCGKIEDPLARLIALPGVGQVDREEIIHAVSTLLETGVPQSRWLPILEIAYPSLAAYLTPYSFDDEPLRDYMGLYARSRIKDSPEGALLEAAYDWAKQRCVWEYPTRASVLHRLGADEAHTFWVDGLGIEWLGLLRSLLLDQRLRVEAYVARASLPSITSTNAEWADGTEIVREIDMIAHSYDYAYPRSLMKQIETIERIAGQVGALCHSNSMVVVTGDHGLTRFAAHGDRVDPPDGYEVHKWGRYARASVGAVVASPENTRWLREGAHLILAGHSLFRGGSRAHGEVHGGATPEESLVPVLCVRFAQGTMPRILHVAEQVRMNARGTATLRLRLDRSVESLEMVMEGVTVTGRRGVSCEWDFTLSELETGSHEGRVYVDDVFIGAVKFEAIRGMQHTDLGL